MHPSKENSATQQQPFYDERVDKSNHASIKTQKCF